MSQRRSRASARCAARHVVRLCLAVPCAYPTPPRAPVPSAQHPACLCLRASPAPNLQSQYCPIVLRYKLSLASLLYCNTIASPSNCIAIHLPPRLATSLSQYNLCIATQSNCPFYCNTPYWLEIKFQPTALTILQYTLGVLQYKFSSPLQPLSHNTIPSLPIQFGQ